MPDNQENPQDEPYKPVTNRELANQFASFQKEAKEEQEKSKAIMEAQQAKIEELKSSGGSSDGSDIEAMKKEIENLTKVVDQNKLSAIIEPEIIKGSRCKISLYEGQYPVLSTIMTHNEVFNGNTIQKLTVKYLKDGKEVEIEDVLYSTYIKTARAKKEVEILDKKENGRIYTVSDGKDKFDINISFIN